MASTNISNKSTFLPVEIELKIFSNMKTMRDVISYALTTEHRTNILKTHAKTILVDNKKLREDDFLTWIKVLTHFADTTTKNNYFSELLYDLTDVISTIHFEFELEHQQLDFDNRYNIQQLFNRFPNIKVQYDHINKILKDLIKRPFREFKVYIQYYVIPLQMNLEYIGRLSQMTNGKIDSLLFNYTTFYMMYFLNAKYTDIMELYKTTLKNSDNEYLKNKRDYKDNFDNEEFYKNDSDNTYIIELPTKKSFKELVTEDSYNKYYTEDRRIKDTPFHLKYVKPLRKSRLYAHLSQTYIETEAHIDMVDLENIYGIIFAQ